MRLSARADGDADAVGDIALRDRDVVADRAGVVVADPSISRSGTTPTIVSHGSFVAGTDALELAAERIDVREMHPRERLVDDGHRLARRRCRRY